VLLTVRVLEGKFLMAVQCLLSHAFGIIGVGSFCLNMPGWLPSRQAENPAS
jgi:hypothetical protein